MPGKPHKPPPGFIGIREIELEARRRGIRFSRSGFERQTEKGKIAPDLQQIRKPRKKLFFLERMEELLRNAPTRLETVPSNCSTSYSMLRHAQRINPRIGLRHVQAFLAKFKANPANASFSTQFKTERHGKKTREIFPREVEKWFLELVQTGNLGDLFSGMPHSKPRKALQPAGNQTGKTTTIPTQRQTTPASATPKKAIQVQAQPRRGPPSWFQRIQTRQYAFDIVQSRIRTAIGEFPKRMPIREFVYYSGLDEFTVRRLVRQGVLVQTQKGEMTVKSIRRALEMQ